MSWATNTVSDGEEATAGSLLSLSVASAAITHQPGFWTCFASRTYSIEVSMGVAVVQMHMAQKVCLKERKKSRKRLEIQYARAAMSVMISDPPPDYEEATRRNSLFT